MDTELVTVCELQSTSHAATTGPHSQIISLKGTGIMYIHTYIVCNLSKQTTHAVLCILGLNCIILGLDGWS